MVTVFSDLYQSHQYVTPPFRCIHPTYFVGLAYCQGRSYATPVYHHFIKLDRYLLININAFQGFTRL